MTLEIIPQHREDGLLPQPLIQDGGKAVREVVNHSMTVEMEGDRQGFLAANLECPKFVWNSNSRDSVWNFEAIIKDIDKEIS